MGVVAALTKRQGGMDERGEARVQFDEARVVGAGTACAQQRAEDLDAGGRWKRSGGVGQMKGPEEAYDGAEDVRLAEV